MEPMTSSPARRQLLPLRTIWLVLPALMGPALADSFADRSRTVQIVSSLLAWGIWGLTLAVMLVPRSVTLTLVRFAVPGSLPVAAWAATGADRAVWAAIGLVAAVVVTLLLAAPGVSDAFVDGSSYGAERRVALRTPALLLVGPVALAWAVGAAGVVAGPLLLAARQWVVGGVALVLGAAVAVLVVRRLHLLSRRWLVFVPAGVVVHDPLTLTEPILFQRHVLRRIAPAPVDTDALDVTNGALGLALEIRGAEPITVGLRSGRDRDERTDVAGLLVTPTRPMVTMALAAEHRLPTG